MITADDTKFTTTDNSSFEMDEVVSRRASMKSPLSPSHWLSSSSLFQLLSFKKFDAKHVKARIHPADCSSSEDSITDLKLKYQSASIFAGISMFAQQLKNHEMSELNLEMSKANENLRITLDQTNANLRIALDQSKVELAEQMERERSNSLLLAQQEKYEILLADAIDAANAQRTVSEDFASRLFDQSKISDRLAELVRTSRLEIDQIRSLFANTAHDLKSPLHTLIVGIEAMREMDVTSDNRQETIDCLDSACAFMHSAISRTMDYSKVSGGLYLSPSNAPFNLMQALSNPIKWMKSMLPVDGRMTILLNPLPDAIEAIISDKHWVEENLLCFLSNAVKYSSRGAINITVTLSPSEETSTPSISSLPMVRVTVEDTGIGIAPESRWKLFKQFSKLQDMATGGTGLGLYSLSKRSEAIGGSCGMHGRADEVQGSVFWFEFPYLPSSSSGASSVASAVPSVSVSRAVSRAPSACPTGMTILIVDDSACVTKCLSKQLEAMGHSVVSACNGSDGVDRMVELKNQLDFVIMDIQMPVMDGIEATRRYRKIEKEDSSRRYLPIICSSANSGGDTEALAVSAGMDSFLPKPFNAMEFSQMVSAFTLSRNDYVNDDVHHRNRA